MTKRRELPLRPVQVSLERWAYDRLQLILKHRKKNRHYGDEYPNQSLILREIVQAYMKEHPEMDPHNEARSRLIVALDMSPREALEAARRLKGRVGAFKLNSAFVGGGPEILADFFQNAGPVFLDMKFHDIPNTVANHVCAATELGKHYLPGKPADPYVSMMTIHTAAGEKAMLAAMEAARKAAINVNRPRPKILGITVLTSLDDDAAWNVGLTKGVNKTVLERAKLARKCGLDGLVCSGKEVEAVREVVGPDMRLVVPGIRPAGGSEDDQARITTPREAIAKGADYLVVGRPITGASDPCEAADSIVNEISSALTDAS